MAGEDSAPDDATAPHPSTAGVRGPESPGRQRLLDAALRLFDENGVHGVSARAIAQAAGHRNVAAVHYHFGDQRSLLLALVAQFQQDIDGERIERIERLEAAGQVDPREALNVIIEPLVDRLDDPDGRRYLRVLNQLASHPEHHGQVNPQFSTGLVRAAVHISPVIAHVPEERRPHRVQAAVGLILFSLARQSRLLDNTDGSGRQLLERDVFLDETLNAVYGVLRG